MRLFRLFAVMCVVCLSLTVAIVGQVYAASDGCNALNSRQADSTTIPNNGVDGGWISLGTYDFTEGEVITVSADSGLSGGIGLHAAQGGVYAAANLPNSAVYTVEASGTYAFEMYFDVSNHTANPVPSKPTVTCAGSENAPDNRNVSLPNGAVYVDADGIFVSSITNFGELAAISLTLDEIAELPAEVRVNTLLKGSGDGFVSLYQLTTGEYQINIGPDAAGNVAVIIFSGLPPTNLYRRDFNVNDILYP